ncbi:hypothetical protein [Amaricoccus macauensis]|uniref:hypothetical protein n=1 Tax=Amaricoccus macauensis TaxID=57001 RepID=UPI003C7B90A4
MTSMVKTIAFALLLIAASGLVAEACDEKAEKADREEPEARHIPVKSAGGSSAVRLGVAEGESGAIRPRARDHCEDVEERGVCVRDGI